MGNKVFEKLKVKELSDILKKGQIVGVRISNEGEWINDVILGINNKNNTIDIELLDEFINNDLMIDDVIQCKLIDDDEVFIFEVQVIDIGITHSKKVTLEITGIKRYPNERINKRFTVNLCGRLVYNHEEKSAFVTVKNISSKGISLVSKECLGLNEEVDVDIVVWKKEVISIEGKIVRMFKTGDKYKYGILVENIDNKSKKILNEFIEELEYFENMKKLSEEE